MVGVALPLPRRAAVTRSADRGTRLGPVERQGLGLPLLRLSGSTNRVMSIRSAIGPEILRRYSRRFTSEQVQWWSRE